MLPAEIDKHSTTFGGWYLGIPKGSRHQAEAVAFIKYVTSAQIQKQRAIAGAFPPTYASLYSDPNIVGANPFFSVLQGINEHIVRRPAALIPGKWDRVSAAYAHGVHAILTHQISAAEGAAKIETDIQQITGLASKVPTGSNGNVKPR